MKRELVTAPATMPITVDEARAHSRVDSIDEDAYLQSLIAVATSHVEQVTWRKLITQTWRLYFDAWPSGVISLPFGEIQSVSLVRWLDENAADHDLVEGTDYRLSMFGLDPHISPVNGWPAGSLFDVDSIRVEFVCGYGVAADVPPPLRHAIKLLVSQWYENREPVVIGQSVTGLPFAVENLLAPYRIGGLV